MELIFDLTFNITGSIILGWFIVLSMIKIQEGLAGIKFEKHKKKIIYQRGILVNVALGLVFYFIGL